MLSPLRVKVYVTNEKIVVIDVTVEMESRREWLERL